MDDSSKIGCSAFLILLAGTAFILVSAFRGQELPEAKTHTPETTRLLVRCPDCHLEPPAPRPCAHETQAWAWEECMDIAMRNPDE